MAQSSLFRPPAQCSWCALEATCLEPCEAFSAITESPLRIFWKSCQGRPNRMNTLFIYIRFILDINCAIEYLLFAARQACIQNQRRFTAMFNSPLELRIFLKGSWFMLVLPYPSLRRPWVVKT